MFTLSRMRKERGAVLALAVGVAFIASVSAFVILQLAIASSRRAQFYREQSHARYAAEAGIIWAQQRLWADPNYCGNPDPPSATFTPAVNVDVTVSNCGAGNLHVVNATVTY